MIYGIVCFRQQNWDDCWTAVPFLLRRCHAKGYQMGADGEGTGPQHNDPDRERFDPAQRVQFSTYGFRGVTLSKAVIPRSVVRAVNYDAK
jgi:hypothetical protein